MHSYLQTALSFVYGETYHQTKTNHFLVQRHSSKICMNCALRDKSANLGTDVEHIMTFVLRYGAILEYSPGVYFADQNFQNLQTTWQLASGAGYV